MTEETRKAIGFAVLEVAGIALVGWYLLTYQMETMTAIVAKVVRIARALFGLIFVV